MVHAGVRTLLGDQVGIVVERRVAVDASSSIFKFRWPFAITVEAARSGSVSVDMP